jgi:hypothetical protein
VQFRNHLGLDRRILVEGAHMFGEKLPSCAYCRADLVSHFADARIFISAFIKLIPFEPIAWPQPVVSQVCQGRATVATGTSLAIDMQTTSAARAGVSQAKWDSASAMTDPSTCYFRAARSARRA